MGYIQPAVGNTQGFVTVRDRYAAHSEVTFDLKDYMQITNQGKAYLKALEEPW